MDVSEKGYVEVWQTFRGNEWENKGERVGGGEGKVAVDVRVAAEKGFYESRGGCQCFDPNGQVMTNLRAMLANVPGDLQSLQ